ncbi:hypothetical protein BD289DRAFT_487077 [Coniella lustricola]|uniref:Uncharacterized protein n=1 Tax=Coniella lustricola TaxID=2025994 RepID=A0A2T2ZSZ7_9PEZI|nr:hypothetical protein BD289DRAFT_487077 [Coniella lustricola]
MQINTIVACLALVGSSLARPTLRAVGEIVEPSRTNTLSKRDAASVIEAIMPKSTSCSGRGDECTTAAVAGPLLAASMTTYSVTTGVEQAGLLALIAYESGELQYKKNTNQDANEGRGTVNEQGAQYNIDYANTFPALAAQNPTTATVLDLVTTDEYNFGTAAWYYSSQSACATARSMSTDDADAWFDEYMANCDGMGSDWATSEPDRETYWTAAKAAFNLS